MRLAKEAECAWNEGMRTHKFAFYFTEMLKQYTDNEYIDFGNESGTVRRLFTFADDSELLIDYSTLEAEVI